VLILTFIFAVLNICLGFALAVYLGYGLADLSGSWSDDDASTAEAIFDNDVSAASESPAAETIEEPVAV
jgi:hypothetical protein